MTAKQSAPQVGPILDSTLRDGRYLGNWSNDLTVTLVTQLDKCGITGIEIGPELGLGDTSSRRFESRDLIFEDIANAQSAKSKSLIGAFFIPGIGIRGDLVRAKDCGLDFIRIGQNPANWISTIEFIEISLSLGLRVFFNLMKSHLVSPREFAEIARQLSDLPLDGIYLVDSTGTFTPDDVRAYISEARESTHHALGFHGHDNLGLAHANSITAWKYGALHVDGTLGGMGRCGGNAATERLSGLTKRLGLAGQIDTQWLCQLSIELGNQTNKYSQESIYLGLICGVFGFHSSWLTSVREVADQFGIAYDQLIEQVAAKNRENPSRELFELTASEIAASLNV